MDFYVTFQVINPREIVREGGVYDTPVTTYETAGETILEAIRKMLEKLPRKPFFSHLRVIIVGEELAKDGFAEVLDFLSRDHEMRTDFYIMVSKGISAKDIVDTLTPLEDIPANKLFQSLEMSSRFWATTKKVQIDELISNLVSEGKHPVLLGVELHGEPEMGKREENISSTLTEARLEYAGIAVFKDDKLIGWLDEEESKGLNFSQGNVQSTVINVPCKRDGKLGIEVIDTTREMKGRFENGKPEIDLTIKIEGNIGDVQCPLDLIQPLHVYDIEQKAQHDLKETIERTILKAQKQYKADIFGFGEAIHRAVPKKWEQINDDWNSHFEDVTVNVNVEVRIRRIGSTGDPFIKEIKG